jgi:hypothetical protein
VTSPSQIQGIPDVFSKFSALWLNPWERIYPRFSKSKEFYKADLELKPEKLFNGKVNDSKGAVDGINGKSVLFQYTASKEVGIHKISLSNPSHLCI